MLRYRLFDCDNSEHLTALTRWYNDTKIRHCSFPHLDADSYRMLHKAEFIKARVQKKIRGQYQLYMISWNGVLVGETSVEFGGGQLLKHHPKSAAVGIVIGEAHARGVGLGARIMRKVEAMAREQGAKRIELAVFEFNHRAIALYERLGYKTFKTLPRKTYWRGRHWRSFYMEKLL